MRKVLLSFLIGCMGFTYGHASTTFNLDGGSKQTLPPDVAPPQNGNPGDNNIDRPRYGRGFETTWLEYDSSSSSLYVHTPDGEGRVYVFLENLFTGDVMFHPYDAFSGVFAIPFLVGEGNWRLCLCIDPIPHKSGILYNCMFSIENGMLRCL